jgi:simple sugar transport system substrate-binding protein
MLLIVGILVATMAPVGAQDAQLKFRMVSHGGVGNPFWIVVINGMNDACALLDADCEWLADPVDNVADMGGYWDDALAANPDGIGTTVPDPEVIRDAVNRAHDAGIPVIKFNTQDPNVSTDSALPALFYIGSVEFLAARLNAQGIVDKAAADGVTINKVVCPIQEVGHSGLEARCAGVRSVFEELGVPVDGLTTSNDVAENAAVLGDYFTANPETNAIVVLGPTPAQAYNLYLQEAGRQPGEIYASTFDTSAEIYEMIKAGYMVQGVDQQPYVQGFETIMWLFLNSQYKLVPNGDILTGPVPVDASNVDAIIELTAQGYR